MVKRLIILLAIFSLNSNLAATEVIVNRDTQVVVMSVEDIRSLFTLKRSHWDNGVRVKLFILPKNSVITKKFAYEILKMPTNMYFDIIESNYSSGKSNIPTILENEYSMLLNLSLNPGGVGYIYEADILIDTPNLRAVKIQENK